MAQARNRYSAVAITLHWVIAALILYNLYLALQLDDLHGLAKFNTFQVHKSVGLTVLMLSLLRLVWRLTHRPPPMPAGMPRWERLGAHAAHWTLYALMIGIPLPSRRSASAADTSPGCTQVDFKRSISRATASRLRQKAFQRASSIRPMRRASSVRRRSALSSRSCSRNSARLVNMR